MRNYSGSITSKLPGVETTIFTVMSKLAGDYKAINLSQGFPDFPISEKLISPVNKYMKKGYNQYAPMQGVPALRERLSEKVKRIHPVHSSLAHLVKHFMPQDGKLAIQNVLHPYNCHIKNL